MLAHLTRDMRKHIALPRKIDSKHGTRQDLSYRAFRYDLSFFRHAPNICTRRNGSRWIVPILNEFGTSLPNLTMRRAQRLAPLSLSNVTDPARSPANTLEVPGVSTRHRFADAPHWL